MNETISSLLAKALVIKDETVAGTNTATRIGQMFEDIIILLSSKAPAQLKELRSGTLLTNARNARNTTNNFFSGNATRFFPFILDQDTEVSSLNAQFVSTGAGTNRIALYNDNGAGYPAEINSDFPETTFTSAVAGIASITPASPVILAAGLYWVGLFTVSSLNWPTFAGETQPNAAPGDAPIQNYTSNSSNFVSPGSVTNLADPAPSGMIIQSIQTIRTWFVIT